MRSAKPFFHHDLVPVDLAGVGEAQLEVQPLGGLVPCDIAEHDLIVHAVLLHLLQDERGGTV